MANQPGWYPPCQVLSPPELPTYLKDVYDIRPVVGVPSDSEMIGIHAVIQVANRASGIPGMHDPGLTMRLADHLFAAQMARYRSSYSLITFPNDATYTPPSLPTHITVNLEVVQGAPSDDAIMKVQEAFQNFQELRRFPSMFDERVNMELSQHLFDLQMARHMRLAGESVPSSVSQTEMTSEIPPRTTESTPNIVGETASSLNNAGTGATPTVVHLEPQVAPGVDIHELLERSNRLAERFNHLLEHSNQLLERCGQPPHESSSQTFADKFNQVLERLTQLVEWSRQPAEGTDWLAERFNQLFERFNQLIEQSNGPAQRASELAQRSNDLAEKTNLLAEQANKPVERIGDLLKNINGVLVGIQHAIVRSRKGNTLHAVDCLVNEKGVKTGLMNPNYMTMIGKATNFPTEQSECCPIIINGKTQKQYIPDEWLGYMLQFYGIRNDLLESPTSNKLKARYIEEARLVLGEYFTCCLG